MDSENVAVELQKHSSELGDHARRIEALEKMMEEQNKLVVSVSRLADNMEQMAREQKEQGERLKTLENRPAKQWSDARKAFFNALLGAMGTAVAGGVLWLIYVAMTKGGI